MGQQEYVKCGPFFSKMAVDVRRISPVAFILFLASTSLGQISPGDLAEFTTTPLPNISETPHEKFNVSFYKKAQKYTEEHWREMSAGDADDFSQFSVHLETRIRQKMAEFAGNPTLSVEEMSTIIQDKIDNGELTTIEVSLLQAHTMATQEAYVERVIQIFDLRPEDLDTTPNVFCDVFEVCQFITTTTLSTSTTTVKITPKITTATSTTTTTTTTTQATTKPATEEEKISSPDTNISDRTPEEVSERSSDVGSVKTEKTITTVEKLEKTTTPSVIEEPEREPIEMNSKKDSEGAKRRSDTGSIKIEETDTTVKKLEKTTTTSVIEVPKEEPSKTNSEGWGSGASRNLDFVSELLLGSLILTLSN